MHTEFYETSGFHGSDYEDVFWDFAPCSLKQIYRHFRGSHRPDDGGTSETSVNFYGTPRRNIPEDSHLHT
jgi:hypothetical protein